MLVRDLNCHSYGFAGNLVITNIEAEDEGTYICNADNQYGQPDTKVSMVTVLGWYPYNIMGSIALHKIEQSNNIILIYVDI